MTRARVALFGLPRVMLTAVAFAAVPLTARAADLPPRPNVLLIVSDDPGRCGSRRGCRRPGT
jgi:hypothetical protein